MTGNKAAAFFLIGILFLFSACKGTPPVNDLNVPMGLLLAERTLSEIKIRFYAYNPEPDFTGFCVYLSTTHTTWEAFQTLSESGKAATLPVVDPYLISSVQGSQQYPTIPYYSFPEVTTKTTLIEYVIAYDGAGNPINAGTTYYIAVSALDVNNSMESAVSNVIQVDP